MKCSMYFNWRKAGKSAAMAAAMATTMGSPTMGHARDIPDDDPGVTTSQTNSELVTKADPNLTPNIITIDTLWWHLDILHVNGKIRPDQLTSLDTDRVRIKTTYLIGYDANHNEISRLGSAYIDRSNDGSFSTTLDDPEQKIKFVAFVTNPSAPTPTPTPTEQSVRSPDDQQKIDDLKARQYQIGQQTWRDRELSNAGGPDFRRNFDAFVADVKEMTSIAWQLYNLGAGPKPLEQGDKQADPTPTPTPTEQSTDGGESVDYEDLEAASNRLTQAMENYMDTIAHSTDPKEIRAAKAEVTAADKDCKAISAKYNQQHPPVKQTGGFPDTIIAP